MFDFPCLKNLRACHCLTYKDLSSFSEETAHLLADLAAIEMKKNAAILALSPMNKHAEEVFKNVLYIFLVYRILHCFFVISFRTSPDNLRKQILDLLLNVSAPTHNVI